MNARLGAFVAGTVAAVVVVVGCGAQQESNGYNQPDPPGSGPRNISNLVWSRIDTPQNYPTSVTACLGTDGLYESQDSGSSIEVVPNDPRCVTHK